MDDRVTDNRSSYRSEYEREYLLGLNMRRMDSLIDDAWSGEHPALRNAMIALQDCEQGTAEWNGAAAKLENSIAVYLESPVAEHVSELKGISEVIRREEVYEECGLTEGEGLTNMTEEECETELKDIGKKLEALDMLEELMQDGQERLAEFSEMLEDTETYGWKGDEYIKLRDDLHGFLRTDVTMTAAEIASAAGILSESAEAYSKISGNVSVNELAAYAGELKRGIDEKSGILGAKEPLDEMQGRLDARMEELIDVSERYRLKKSERKKTSIGELKQSDEPAKKHRTETVRETRNLRDGVVKAANVFFGKS
ncbi:MAG: hypothetical protein K5686_04305 [Lachnospiraceae bacterium]|nr:hypothetical protein [Lachnospiraceae bacterium]